MTEDKLAHCRARTRAIVELRYHPLIEAFDRRGMLLRPLHSDFKAKMEYWRVDNVAVQLLDNMEKPLKQITVSHLHSVLIYEDPGSIQEFFDDSKRLIKILLSVFPELWESIERVGVRFLSVLNAEGYSSFAQIYDKVKSAFFAPEIPLTLPISDCRAVLQHATGICQVGPVRKGEEWLRNLFPARRERPGLRLWC